jgi:hypothetical protein
MQEKSALINEKLARSKVTFIYIQVLIRSSSIRNSTDLRIMRNTKHYTYETTTCIVNRESWTNLFE